MFKKLGSLSRKAKVGLSVLAVLGLFGTIGANTQPKANLQSTNAHSVLGAQTDNTTKAKPAPVITTQTAIETQSIPFTSTTAQTATLPKGTSKVTTVGVNGVSTLTYKVTLTDNVQTNKELVSQVTTAPPVTQVTSIGTYVTPAPAPAAQLNCPNGTYVYSVGNTVCSPYAASTAPADATAKCVDGTYSFSQSHSGTCSHHGGVAAWL